MADSILQEDGGEDAVSANYADTAEASAAAAAASALAAAAVVAATAVQTIALLKAVLTTAPNKAVLVLGYYAARDGGGGVYALDAGDTTTADDGGAVIVANDGGRWKLVHGLSIDARQYGAKFDGSTNDSAAINAALTYVKANGLTLRLPAGTTKVKNLRLESGVKAWAMVGAGEGTTLLEHADGDSTLLQTGVSGSPLCRLTLSDFTIDCRWSQLAHASANGGLEIQNVSGLRIERLTIKNYKNYAALIYDAGNTGAYSDNKLIDVTAIGNGATTNNGMLIANMHDSGFIRCSATDCDGSPGYAVQLKNNCLRGFIVDSWGKNCKAAVAFGNDASPTAGVQRSYVRGGRSYGCDSGFVGGEIFDCSIHMAFVDMENFAGYPVVCDGASTGNDYLIDTVVNLASNRTVFSFEDTANGNKAHVAVAKDRNTTGGIATFSDTAANNHVTFDTLIGPTNHTNGFRSLGSFGTTSGNSLTSPRLQAVYRVTIASDAITIRNDAATLMVETANEASAATDDLATITGSGFNGQRITLRTTSNSQKVTVKHATGNIHLSQGADFTLNDQKQSLTLEYSTLMSGWCQMPLAYSGSTVAAKTGTAYTVVNLDVATYMRFTNASAKAVTFDSTLVMGEYHVRNVGAADLTLTAGSGVTLNAPSGGTLVMATNMTATVKKVGAAEFDVIGQTKP